MPQLPHIALPNMLRLSDSPVGVKHSDPFYLCNICDGLRGPPRCFYERFWPQGGLLSVTCASEVASAEMSCAIEPDRRTVGCFSGGNNENTTSHGVTVASRAHRGGVDL